MGVGGGPGPRLCWRAPPHMGPPQSSPLPSQAPEPGPRPPRSRLIVILQVQMGGWGANRGSICVPRPALKPCLIPPSAYLAWGLGWVRQLRAPLSGQAALGPRPSLPSLTAESFPSCSRPSGLQTRPTGSQQCCPPVTPTPKHLGAF